MAPASSASNRFIEDYNKEPKPFVWKADPGKIIAAVIRGHQTLRSIQQDNHESVGALAGRYEIGRLSDKGGDRPAKKRFKAYLIGSFRCSNR